MKMSSRSKALAAAIAVLFISTGARSWWHVSHSIIDRAAMLVMPHSVPRFFQRGVETIAAFSSDPDLQRNRALPALSSTERPDHFFDLELLEGRALPRTRAEFVAMCGEMGLDPYQVGMAPYSITEWYERLVFAFTEYRLRPRDRSVQAKVLYIAAVLSHYTADAAQPLHCTVHFDGRLKEDGTSPRSGIHVRMDALPAACGLSAREVAGGLEVKQPLEDVFTAAVEFVTESNALVDRVYELEGRLPPAEESGQPDVDAEVREFALSCSRRAALFTARVWCTAWVKSRDVQLPEWYQ